MARLEDISLDALADALDDATKKKETMRLIVAIIYKQGPSVPMLADWLDIREATIYRWFDRLEEGPVIQAVQDRPKPGRPPKLADEEREQVTKAMQNPPTAVGFDRADWTTELVQQFLNEEFGVEYSLRHVQRLRHNNE